MEQSKWTDDEVKILIKMYPDHNCTQISKHINRSVISIESKAFRLKLKKEADWLNNPNANKFVKGYAKEKGIIPHNKGKKQSDYMSAEAIEKIKGTHFKKGHKPVHASPIGSIVLRGQKDDVKPYQWIKISEKKWIPLHHKIWQEKNGKIPKNHIIIFKDSDHMNTVIDNLEMITKSELIDRNRDSKYPMELRELIRIKNQLIKKLWQRTKSLI